MSSCAECTESLVYPCEPLQNSCSQGGKRGHFPPFFSTKCDTCSLYYDQLPGTYSQNKLLLTFLSAQILPQWLNWLLHHTPYRDFLMLGCVRGVFSKGAQRLDHPPQHGSTSVYYQPFTYSLTYMFSCFKYYKTLCLNSVAIMGAAMLSYIAGNLLDCMQDHTHYYRACNMYLVNKGAWSKYYEYLPKFLLCFAAHPYLYHPQT